MEIRGLPRRASASLDVEPTGCWAREAPAPQLDWRVSFCDFSFDSDTLHEVSCEFFEKSHVATQIAILMRVKRAAWRERFHFDNIRIEPPP